MGYQIKTSNDGWQELATKLYYNRISIDIINDGNIYLTNDSEIFKKITKTSFKKTDVIWSSIFYILGLVCAYLFLISLSVSYGREIAVVFSVSCFICSVLAPTLVITRKKHPKIIIDGKLIKIVFK